MKVEVVARHNHVSERMKSYAEEKANKVSRYFDRISRVQILLETVHDERRVEIVAHVDTGAILVADERNGDMFAAIDLAAEKLKHQITRHKERLVERHRHKTEETGAQRNGTAAEETFDQIIRREFRG